VGRTALPEGCTGPYACPVRRERIDADQAFFTERLALRPGGGRRSLVRAAALAAHLGIDLAAWRRHPERVIIVVGSKGKGTAATFASAALAAAGLRVGTLTSPGLRSNRERIRIDGRAISLSDYLPLVGNVAATLERVGDSLPGGGYLSPSGLFLLTALRHFAERGCAAVVLEAGMGGASDEVSLLSPGVAVITPVLGEHLGVLGESVPEIAVEKAGVVGEATREVVVAPQPDPEAKAAMAGVLGRRDCRVDWLDRGEAPLPPSVAPPGLGAGSAAAGVHAALRLLEARGEAHPDPDRLDAVLRSISLPGRLSQHRRGAQRWVVDCATNPAAVAAALAHCAAGMGMPSAVLTYFPRHRDTAPLRTALAGERVVAVPGGPRRGPPGTGATMDLGAIDLDALGARVLALGPVYFAGEVLATLGVDCEQSFDASVQPVGRPAAAP
jgi:dihydrofolate synthase/folylpolyglutamate synthase